VKPAIATIGIFTFLDVWNNFLGPLIYITDQRLFPMSLGLFALQVLQGGSFAYGLMMAASVLMILPVIVLFFSAQRTFIQGVTLTGLKG
jgi:ABC-type glycerol-3-phosphate transport system permease component